MNEAAACFFALVLAWQQMWGGLGYAGTLLFSQEAQFLSESWRVDFGTILAFVGVASLGAYQFARTSRKRT